jgi:hypothetical protein
MCHPGLGISQLVTDGHRKEPAPPVFEILGRLGADLNRQPTASVARGLRGKRLR